MMTWKCHVCGETRPDEFISVFKRDISERFNLPPGTFSENIRYCNDRDCADKAPRTTLTKGIGDVK